MSTQFLAISLLLLALATRAPVQASDLRCYSTWSEAAPKVRAEGLVSIRRLSRLVQKRTGGRIVNSRLCRNSDRFVYKLMVRRTNGTIKFLTLDAKRPFP